MVCVCVGQHVVEWLGVLVVVEGVVFYGKGWWGCWLAFFVFCEFGSSGFGV